MGAGKRLHFVEFGDYASAGDQPAHRIAGDLTIEAWIRAEPMALATMRGGIVTKLYTDGGPDSHGGFGLLLGKDSRLVFYVAGNYVNIVTAPSVADGQWHHVAGVYDGASLAIFVDGVRRTSGSVVIGSSAPVYQPDTDLLIGRHRLGPNKPLQRGVDSLICEVRLWSRARTADELSQMMGRHLTGSEADLVGYWPLDEGEGVEGRDLRGTAPLTALGGIWTDSSPLLAAASPSERAHLAGMVDTSSMLSAALESLNRASALHLLGQLIQTLNTEDASSSAKLNSAKAGLAQALHEAVEEFSTSSTAITQSIAGEQARVDELDTSIHAQISRLPADLDAGVASGLAARRISIQEGALQAVLPRIEGVVDEVVEHHRVADLSRDASALQESVEQALTRANALSPEELARVGEAIESAIAHMDLAPLINGALISVNGALVRLGELAQRLTTRPEIERVDLTYDDENLTSAVFSFDDNTTAAFSATRIDLPDLAVHYRLRCASLRGLPAEIELRFARTSETRRLGNRDVTFDVYEPVYQSRIHYSIVIP